MNPVGTFRNSSIKAKLSLLAVFNGSFALLIAGVFLLGYEKFALHEGAADALAIQAGIVADSSAAPLSFNDERAAMEALKSLRSDPNLVDAAIYDREDCLFAFYTREQALSRLPPKKKPGRSGVYFEGGDLFASQPVLLRSSPVGSIVLRASMAGVDSRLHRYTGMLCIALVVSLALALLLSARMQRTITRPIAQLSGVARLVSKQKDYSVRAVRQASDEVGFLIDSFNDMLAQIEIREQARIGAEESLRESEERFALAAKGANDGLWDWKRSTALMYLSPRGNQMLGHPEAEKWWTSEEWEKQIHPADRDRVHAEWAALDSRNRDDYVIEYRMRRLDGTFIWVLARGKAVRDENGTAVRIAGSLTDVTDGKIADPLTGLHNRLYFLDRLESASEEARESDMSFAVLFLDVDRFKLVNDSLGHAAGDEFLVEVARRLEGSLEAGVASQGQNADGPSILARLGGDEFAILQHGSQPGAAESLAERILERFREPICIASRQMFGSLSIGVALSSADCTPEDLLRNADTAMYHAKTGGRASFEIFDEKMRERAIARLEIETDLRKGIEDNQLVLYYQPQVSLPECRITGCEALVRWRHPEHGLIMPGEFISIAEEADLIVPLGRWVLTQACRQMAAWQRQFTFDPPLTVSVNVSFNQLRGAGFVEDLKRVLDETGVHAALRLEMTESTVMTNAEETVSTLLRLKELNVGLEIDDFGTGYSSLSHLSRLPFDTVKIDCSFIANLGSDGESSEIVRAILELARSMNMNVVAEGVETCEQLRILNALNCSHAQGYLFSKPVDAAAMGLVFETEAFRHTFWNLAEAARGGCKRAPEVLPCSSREDAVLVGPG